MFESLFSSLLSSSSILIIISLSPFLLRSSSPSLSHIYRLTFSFYDTWNRSHPLSPCIHMYLATSNGTFLHHFLLLGMNMKITTISVRTKKASVKVRSIFSTLLLRFYFLLNKRGNNYFHNYCREWLKCGTFACVCVIKVIFTSHYTEYEWLRQHI